VGVLVGVVLEMWGYNSGRAVILVPPPKSKSSVIFFLYMLTYADFYRGHVGVGGRSVGVVTPSGDPQGVPPEPLPM